MNQETDQYREIFLKDLPLLDLRAPAEYTRGRLPNSTSIPLMTDEERAAVGTCYKHEGREAAVELGHHLVNGNVRAERIAAWRAWCVENPHGLITCWRGGMRSAVVQEWLHEASFERPRVVGGYKAMRRFLKEELDRIVIEKEVIVIAGRSGSRKTALLGEFPNSIDLEGLANHLGSTFGKRPEGQPTQASFENALGVAFLKQDANFSGKVLFIEDESKLVGRSALPHSLVVQMQRADLVLLEVPFDERVDHSYRNYIVGKLSDWERVVGVEAAFEAFSNDLRESLFNIRKRLGRERYQEVLSELEAALVCHREGDPGNHRGWVARVLREYYDPMYDYQISQKADRIRFRGTYDESREYLTLLSNCD